VVHDRSSFSVLFFLLKAKPQRIEASKRKGALNHTHKRHRQTPLEDMKECTQNERMHPLIQIPYKRVQLSASCFFREKNWRFSYGNGYAESHYKMTYDCNVELADKLPHRLLDLKYKTFSG